MEASVEQPQVVMGKYASQAQSVESIESTTISRIMADLAVALNKANDLTTVYSQKINFLNDLESSYVERETLLKNQQYDLIKRENKIKKIEDLSKLFEDNTLIAENAKKSIETLKSQQDEFNTTVKLENDRLTNLREVVQRESFSLENNKKYIEDQVASRVKECLANMGYKQG